MDKQTDAERLLGTYEDIVTAMHDALDPLLSYIYEMVDVLEVLFERLILALRPIITELRRLQLYLVCRRKGIPPLASKLISRACPWWWLPELDVDLLWDNVS